MLQGPINTETRAGDQSELNPKRVHRTEANFSELYDQTPADERPRAVVDEIILMLIAETEAEPRIQRLLKKYEESNSNGANPEDFQHELDLIRQYGVFEAVDIYGLDLKVLCAMVDDPVLCKAAHLACIGSGDNFIAQKPLPRLC